MEARSLNYQGSPPSDSVFIKTTRRTQIAPLTAPVVLYSRGIQRDQPKEEMRVGAHKVHTACVSSSHAVRAVTLWPIEVPHTQSVANQGRLSELGCSYTFIGSLSCRHDVEMK